MSDKTNRYLEEIGRLPLSDPGNVNPPDLRRLRELEEKATPGPWRLESESHTGYSDSVPDAGECRVFFAEYDQDAPFITAMRNALPALLECVEALEHYANEGHWDAVVRDPIPVWEYDGGHGQPWEVAQKALAKLGEADERS